MDPSNLTPLYPYIEFPMAPPTFPIPLIPMAPPLSAFQYQMFNMVYAQQMANFFNMWKLYELELSNQMAPQTIQKTLDGQTSSEKAVTRKRTSEPEHPEILPKRTSPVEVIQILDKNQTVKEFLNSKKPLTFEIAHKMLNKRIDDLDPRQVVDGFKTWSLNRMVNLEAFSHFILECSKEDVENILNASVPLNTLRRNVYRRMSNWLKLSEEQRKHVWTLMKEARPVPRVNTEQPTQKNKTIIPKASNLPRYSYKGIFSHKIETID